MCCSNKYVANDLRLIRINKFISWINEDFYNLFYYYYLNTLCDTLNTNVVPHVIS